MNNTENINSSTIDQNFKVFVRCYTYNHKPYIIDALKGFIMQQTNFPYVVTIVDDASIDGEQEVIKEFLNQEFNMETAIFKETEYAHIIETRHITNKNCTFAVLLLKYNHYQIKKNKRPYLAKWISPAKYEAICEGDDYWVDPLKLKKQVDFLESHPEYSMSHTNNLLYNQKDAKFKSEPKELLKTQIGNNLNCEDIIKYTRIILTLTVVIRKSIYENVIKSDPYIFESGNFLLGDIPLWYGAARLGKIHYLKDKTAVYRHLENSVSHTNDKKNRYKFSVSAQGLRAYLCRRDKLSKELSVLIENRYANALFHHWVLNPKYVPIVPLLPNTFKFELFLKKYKILGFYLLIKDILHNIKKINKSDI